METRKPCLDRRVGRCAHRSRADVLPLTWEAPTALVSSWLLLGVLALPTGQGMFAALAGNGFAWPSGALVECLVGLLWECLVAV